MTDFLRLMMEEVERIGGGFFKTNIHTEADERGSWRIGLNIRENNLGGTVVPLISFLRKYKNGIPISELAQQAVARYEQINTEENEKCSWLNDYEQVRERIVCRIVNKERVSSLLKERFHIEYLEDLAVLFYVVIDIEIPKKNDDYTAVPVTFSMFCRWGRDEEEVQEQEVQEQAVKNMTRLYPNRLYELCTMKHHCADYPEYKLDEMEVPELGIVVSTNQQERWGATGLLDRGWLKKLADLLDSDLYIIAASVNELSLQTTSGFLNVAGLKQMAAKLAEKNSLDFLSDSVYYFERGYEEIYKVA